MDIKYCFLRDLEDRGVLGYTHYSTGNLEADVSTEPIQATCLKNLRILIGLVDHHHCGTLRSTLQSAPIGKKTEDLTKEALERLQIFSNVIIANPPEGNQDADIATARQIIQLSTGISIWHITVFALGIRKEEANETECWKK
ncbi:hypothetical protein JTB14_031906 [Gonioctena quinquepunctata]|nr:hypothetical protein JTB14_031906 [Gonioctena quinquepunctata]